MALIAVADRALPEQISLNALVDAAVGKDDGKMDR